MDGSRTPAESWDVAALTGPLKARDCVGWRAADALTTWFDIVGEDFGTPQQEDVIEAMRTTLGALMRHELDDMVRAWLAEGGR